MLHPEITRELAAEHRRDMLRDADNYRLAREARLSRATVAVDTIRVNRLWLWARRPRRQPPAETPATTASSLVPMPRSPLDIVIDLTSTDDRAALP